MLDEASLSDVGPVSGLRLQLNTEISYGSSAGLGTKENKNTRAPSLLACTCGMTLAVSPGNSFIVTVRS